MAPPGLAACCVLPGAVRVICRAVRAAQGGQPQPGFAVRCIGDAAVVRVVARPNLADPTRQVRLRVRVKKMGSQKCRIVGESQSVLIMIDPMIFARMRGPVI